MFVLFYTLLFFFKMMELGSGSEYFSVIMHPRMLYLFPPVPECIENTGYCVTLCIQNLSSPPQIHVTMGEEGSGSTGPELTTTAVDQFPPPSADAALCAPGDPGDTEK